MRVIVAGGGIGGLTAAMALQARGIDVQVYESVVELQPLGVGINLLPHAMAHLQRLDLPRSEEHTSELQSHHDLVCRLLL